MKKEKHTPFKPVDSSRKLPGMEEEILKFWNEHKIFEKSVENRKTGDDDNLYSFYDGPPFATGLPHYGHIVGTFIKDTVPRYWTMKGKYIPRKWGWDCHGLPIENLVEKELGSKTKKEIEELGVEKFNNLCRSKVLEFADEWKKIINRLGRWVDMEHPYRTMDRDFMESVWWVFKELWQRDLIYYDYRSMHICPRCETTLSQSEVSEGYKNVKDLSVIAKFELEEGQKIKGEEIGKNAYILAWTTTPWTLPGNVALAVGKDIDYVLVEKKNENTDKPEQFILAENRLKEVFRDENQEYKVIDESKGKDLIGLKYKPLWDVYANDENLENRENGWQVYDADFVTTDEGTGVVHIAPAFGEDDMNLGKEKNLPFVQHVAMNGTVDEKVEAIGGLNVKPIDNPQATDVEVIKYLAGKVLLFAKEKYEHSYPHCWRCDTPLINYATGSWFVAVTKIKEQLLENAKDINWTPKHIKEGRFGKWLAGARDWSISRQRFWASVIPVWTCEKCGRREVFGSVAEVESKLKSFFLLRHGEAEHNIHNILSGKVGDRYFLTEKGIADVKKAAERLEKTGVDLIIASDLDRTKQTAEIVAEITGAKIIFDKRLREIDFGEYEGRKESDLKDFIADWYKVREGFAFPKGESWETLFERAKDFYEHMMANHYDKRVVVVSHGDTLVALEAVLENKGDIYSAIRKILKSAYPQKAELIEKSYRLTDLHKHIVDKIGFACSECDGTMKRVPDVLDTWFDSGSMPYGQQHYPFDNKETFEKGFPADFIAEGIDQTRAWFYYLHVVAGGIFNKKAFKNVIVNGIVLAEDGQKMSKKLKNYPDPMEMVQKYGSDPLRFYLMQSPVVNANDLNFSEKDLAEIARGMFRMLWQSYSFFVMYANIDKFTVPHFAKASWGKRGLQFTESKNILDRWLVSELHQLIKEVNKRMENYELMQATRLFAPFIDNLSNWYIRRSRKRFWKSENDTDKNQAYATLYYVLVELAKTIAPFAPFIAEEIYRNLVHGSPLRQGFVGQEQFTVHGNKKLVHSSQFAVHSNKKSGSSGEVMERGVSQSNESLTDISVHLADYPVADDDLIDDELNKKMGLVREIISEGLKLRARTQIKVRQPLARLSIATAGTDADFLQTEAELMEIIKEELNVKEVVQEKFTFDKDAKNMGEVDGIKIALDTKITPALKLEGQAREIIRFIQQMRKEADYQLDDRIEVAYQGLDKVFEKFGDLISHETLAKNLSSRPLNGFDLEKEIEIDKTIVKLQIRRK